MSSHSHSRPHSLSSYSRPTENAALPSPRSRTTSVAASRRRDKPQLSCNLCRRRKLRCDRQQPSCSTCSARGLVCTYADQHGFANPPLKLAKIDTTTGPSLQDRIMQLEALVKSLTPGLKGASVTQSQFNDILPHPQLIGGDGSVNASPEDTPMDERSECGSMRLSTSEVCFIGSEHWAAILDSIADLKDHFEQDEEHRLTEGSDDHNGDRGGAFDEPKRSSRHASLLYHAQPARSRMEIIAALPPKDAVDRYVARFFNSMDLVASSAVHGPTFLREYEQFWSNPETEMSIIWVGLLFGMICLAVLSSDTSTNSTPSVEAYQQRQQVDLYRQKIVQCLVMGQYTRAAPYVLETVINYVYIEFLIPHDANKDLWFLLALEVSLAMKMGYHRDPSHFPSITPIQAEMRRRLWSTVLLGDTLISSQMGMPCMINESVYDTAEPQNLNDDELQEHMELPPSRPETEHTTTLGIIARRRVVIALRKVSELTASIQPFSYGEIMRIDSIIQDAAANIPPPLKNKSMATSITDSPHLIMSRLFLSHLVHKGQIMLHRRFLFLDDGAYSYSQKTCLDASLGSLDIQAVLDQEMCPGGQLHSMRFRVGSLMNHHFLSATMILCSLVHRQRVPADRQDEIFAALRRAKMIWLRLSTLSREAKKAAETIDIILTMGMSTSTPGPVESNDEEYNVEGGSSQPLMSTADPFLGTQANFGGMTFETQSMLQEMGFLSSSPFSTPEPLRTGFTPTAHPNQEFNFGDANVTMNGNTGDWSTTMMANNSGWR